MAALKWTVVQSRVGRRVAALFALSGLVPLLILAGVTSWMVSDYLLRQEQGRLRVLAKESAMAAFERLLDVEDRLRVIAAQPADTIAPASLRGVAALARVDRQGRAVTVFGDIDPPALDDADRARLAAGGSRRAPAAAGTRAHPSRRAGRRGRPLRCHRGDRGARSAHAVGARRAGQRGRHRP